MLGNKMDFSSCVIWTGFHKSSHILSNIAKLLYEVMKLLNYIAADMELMKLH